MEGHTAAVTCVQFAPNGLFAISGSEDTTVRVWGLTLNLAVAAFTDHQAALTAVTVLTDSKRVLSADSSGVLMLWIVETGVLLLTCHGPGAYIRVTPDRRYALSGAEKDHQLVVWTLNKDDTKNMIGHNDAIKCFDVSSDSVHVITGSADASLKVWTIADGRLTQVLVGHETAVTSVAYPAYVHRTAVSGGDDALVLVWNVETGQTRVVIRDHQAALASVRVTADAGHVVSGAVDGRLLVHDASTGQRVAAIDLHATIADICISHDAGKITARLKGSMYFALLSLLNVPKVKTPARVPEVKDETNESDSLRTSETATISPAVARRPPPPHRRMLKKGISLDTYTWQRKYGGLLGKMAPLSPVNGDRPRRKISEDEVRMSPIGGTIHTSQQSATPRRADSREQICTAGGENGVGGRSQAAHSNTSAPRKRQLSRTNTALVLSVGSDEATPAGTTGAPSGMPESLLRLRRAVAGCGQPGGGLMEFMDMLHGQNQRSKFCSIL